jgi:hypothetical protein
MHFDRGAASIIENGEGERPDYARCRDALRRAKEKAAQGGLFAVDFENLHD